MMKSQQEIYELHGRGNFVIMEQGLIGTGHWSNTLPETNIAPEQIGVGR